MTHAQVARRSGVPEPTVKRILGGRSGHASFANVSAVAGALGVSLDGPTIPVDEFRRQQARDRAEFVTRLVQGTSALEGQAIDQEVRERLLERTYRDLLSGPSRRLWDG
jgi:transcriptional regulator with XRE-family HTH domain